MSYDTQQFYNAGLAIVAGTGAAAVSFRLMPPLSPVLRTRRLLGLTLRDLRRIATGCIPWKADDWEGRIYGRLAALPDAAEPLQRSQFLAALSVGTDVIDKNFFQQSAVSLGRKSPGLIHRTMSDFAVHLMAASLASGPPCQ